MIVEIYKGNHRCAPARIRHADAWWYFTGRTGIAHDFDQESFDVAEYEHDIRSERCWYDFEGNPVEERQW